MNKKYIVTNNEEIQILVQKGKKIINKFFVIYNKDNNLNYNRYCISVSKKLGKAVFRNKIKRQIKDILMKNNLKGSKDYVIIIRHELTKLSYLEKQKEIINIIGGRNEE